MQVDMEFHHPDDPRQDHSQTKELPELPRVGDQVLWTEFVGAEELEWMREYVVRGVDWAMSPGDDPSAVRLRLDVLGDR